MERTSRLRGMLKNQIPRLENVAKMNMALYSSEKRNQAHTECVDSGLLCVPTSIKSISRITVNIYLSFLYILSLTWPECVCMNQTDRDRDNRKREIVCVCVCVCVCVSVCVRKCVCVCVCGDGQMFMY